MLGFLKILNVIYFSISNDYYPFPWGFFNRFINRFQDRPCPRHLTLLGVIPGVLFCAKRFPPMPFNHFHQTSFLTDNILYFFVSLSFHSLYLITSKGCNSVDLCFYQSIFHYSVNFQLMLLKTKNLLNPCIVWFLWFFNHNFSQIVQLN